MKHILITIAAVVLVGCGESQQSVPPAEAKPVEPVAEAATPEPPTGKALNISIHDAARTGNIEAVKQHLTAGTDVNAMDKHGGTPLLWAISSVSHKEIAELLISKGADVNAKDKMSMTPLHYAAAYGQKEIAELLIENGADLNAKDVVFGKTPLDSAKNKFETADLLRKHGGKTKKELEAAGK